MRQRGFAEGWIYLIVVVLIMTLCLAIAHTWSGSIKEADTKGYDRGVEETLRRVADRDNAALKAAQARILELEGVVHGLEQEAQRRVAEIDAKRQKEIRDAKAQADRDIAAARSGSIGLHDPGKTATACPAPSGERSGSAIASGAGQRDGGQASDLSREAVQFLLLLVDDADDVARQLANAQALITQDRATCNAIGSK